MGRFSKNISINSSGLKSKILIAFCLTTIIPILLLLNYIFPNSASKSFIADNLGLVLTLAFFFALLGFFILKGVIDSIINVSSSARGIAAGYESAKKTIGGSDEIGSLNNSLSALSEKVKSLEVEDSLTGLYKPSFLKEKLEEEIKRAISFQRPCAFMLIKVDRFKNIVSSSGFSSAEKSLKTISNIIKDCTSEIDKVARFSDEKFAVVVPERNKKQAIVLAEDIRKKVESIFSSTEKTLNLTITGVVTENPVDGMTSEELIEKAQRILTETNPEESNQILS